MTKAATPCFTPRIPSASSSTIRAYRHKTVGLRASNLDTIMHDVAEAGSVRASQWLRREHAAYVTIPLLALDAWLSRNNKKRTRNVSWWADYRTSLRGLGFIRSKYEGRNRIYEGNGRSK